VRHIFHCNKFVLFYYYCLDNKQEIANQGRKK